MRKAIAHNSGIEVLVSYCEGLERNIKQVINPSEEGAEWQLDHLVSRAESEDDFFGFFNRLTPYKSRPKFIVKGAINAPENTREIINKNPDLIVAFGCSIIKASLLEAFEGCFLNLHLGLSPYYRGAGTNFWPLVNGEPEYVGATFMQMDHGIDTGPIHHQLRARMLSKDTPHQIGNRLIAESAEAYIDIINKYHNLTPVNQKLGNGKFYKRTDFSIQSVKRLYTAFADGMIAEYLQNKTERDSNAPIYSNPSIGGQRFL